MRIFFLFRIALAAAITWLAMSIAAQAETLRIYSPAEPQSLDPQKVTGDWPDWIIGDMFEGLVTEDAAGNPVAGQAESWTVSADGLTYAFKLRHGLRWSDGQPVTAGDFVFAFRRLVDPATEAEFAFIQYPIRNAEAINSGSIQDSAQLGVSAPDDGTVVVALERPTPFLLQALVQPSAYPLPRHVVERLGADWAKPENIVVNGTYRIAEWEHGKLIRSIRNELYRGADKVKIDEVEYSLAVDDAAALARYNAGKLDILTHFEGTASPWSDGEHDGEARITPTLGVRYYALNFKEPAFALPGIRKALSMAIDRDALVAELDGELPAYGFVPPGVPGFEEGGYKPDWASVPHSERLELARAVLEKAGYGERTPLKIALNLPAVDGQPALAPVVAAMWKPVGVEVEPRVAELPEHHKVLFGGAFQAVSAHWLLDYNDGIDTLNLLRSGAPNNYQHYVSSRVDALLAAASVETDMEKRGGMLHDAEKTAMDDTALIPLYWLVSKNIVSPKISGFVDNVRNVHRTRWLARRNSQ